MRRGEVAMHKPRGSVTFQARSSASHEATTVDHDLLRLLGVRILCWLAPVALVFGAAYAAAQNPACLPNTENYPCVYVANAGDNTVSVINATTNRMIGVVSVGELPQGVAVTPDNKFVYVAEKGDNQVSVIDTSTNKVITTVKGLTGQAQSQVSITPDGKFVYAVEPGSDFSKIDKIDTATNTVVDSVKGGTYPVSIAFAPSGPFAYVSDRCPAENVACLDVVDTSLTPPTVTSTIPIPGSVFSVASSVAVTPDGSLVCVSLEDANRGFEIAFISTKNDAVNLVHLGVVSDPTNYGLSITPKGILYAAEPGIPNASLRTVASINTRSPTKVTPIPVGTGPTGTALGPGGISVYVTNANGDSVSMIDAATNVVHTVQPLGSLVGFNNPQGVAAMSASGPIITTQPASQVIPTGLTATMSVVATSAAPLSYQWYQGLAGDTSTPIEEATGSSFTTPVLISSTSYWVQVRNVAATVNSDTATVTVTTNDPPICTLSVAGAGSQSFSNPLTVVATANCIDPQGFALTTTIDFGRGEGSSSGVNNGVFTASHTYQTYTQQQNFNISVMATDIFGLQAPPAQYSWTLVPAAVVPPVFSGQRSEVTVVLRSPSGLPVVVEFKCTTVTTNTTTGSSPTVRQASEVGINCSSSPPTITLTADPQPVKIVIQTTGPASPQVAGTRRGIWFYAFWMPLPFLILVGVAFSSIRSLDRRFSCCLALIGFTVLFLSGSCGGGFTAPNVQLVTPAGNYQVTVVDLPVGSTSGFVQTSLIVPLTVSPFQ